MVFSWTIAVRHVTDDCILSLGYVIECFVQKTVGKC